jgi:MFS transporter, CP family, cyanate transporter
LGVKVDMQLTPTAESKTNNHWGVVVVALFVGVIAAGHVGKLPPALPSIRTQLGLDIVTAGWLASMFSAIGAVGALFLGAIADQLNPWRLAVGGLVLMMISGFVGSFATVTSQLIISRFFEGVGFLAVVIAAPSIIGRATGGRARRMALGLWPAYMPAGVSLMMLAAPLALNAGGWRALWIAVAAVAMLGTVAMWVFGESPSAEQANTFCPLEWQNARIAILQLGPWLIGACFALYGMQLYAVITWMPTFMVDERGFSPSLAGALTAVVVIGNGLGNLLGGLLLHRGATPGTMIVVSGVMMMLFAFGMFAISLPDIARYLCTVLLCGVGGVIASAAFAVVPNFVASPRQLGIVNGILVQASNLAQFAGPVGLAICVAIFGGWESAVWAFIGVNVLLISVAALTIRRGRRLAKMYCGRVE